MEIMRIQQLRALAEQSHETCISVYMPIRGPGLETRQNSIRLKNLVERAEKRFRAEGAQAATTQQVLSPARDLVRDSSFWRTSAAGLALYLADDFFQPFRVPLEFPERLEIARHFELSPVLPLFTAGGRFYLLALSQACVRLFEATKITIEEIGLDIPHSIQETEKYDVHQRHQQLHTSGAKPAVRGKESAVFHAQGEGVDNAREKVLDYFRQVDHGVSNYLSDAREPLVLATVKELHPIYRQANTYRNLADQVVPGNPDMAGPDELHRAALEVLKPYFEEGRNKAVATFKDLIGTPKASSDVTEILPATIEGKVDYIVVRPDAKRWGRFDTRTGAVEIHSQASPGDEDLISKVATQTILQRGAVYAADSPDSLIDSPVGAVFRYAD